MGIKDEDVVCSYKGVLEQVQDSLDVDDCEGCETRLNLIIHSARKSKEVATASLSIEIKWAVASCDHGRFAAMNFKGRDICS